MIKNRVVPENISWLLEEGGPCIRYRTYRELSAAPDARAMDHSLEELSSEPRVVKLLGCLRAFDPDAPMTVTHLNKVHGSKPETLENAVSVLLEYGFHAGIPEFDEVMQPLGRYVTSAPVLRALDASDGECDIEAARAVFVAVMVSSFFLRAGYDYPGITSFTLDRLAKISAFTSTGSYSVFIDDGAFPVKRPAVWANTPVLKSANDPLTGSRPVPLIHDLFAFAYLPSSARTAAVAKSIGNVVGYILDPRFYTVERGYGLLWSGKERRYYGCGWSPHFARADVTGGNGGLIVLHAELLSRLEGGAGSDLMKKYLEILDGFRLPGGRYLFPRAYLPDKTTGYYVGGCRMGLEANRRQRKAFELESTFRRELISSNPGKIG